MKPIAAGRARVPSAQAGPPAIRRPALTVTQLLGGGVAGCTTTVVPSPGLPVWPVAPV
jgi:hypothetical protein